MTTFGIADHFKEKLSDKIEHSNFVSISYGVSLNLSVCTLLPISSLW